MVSVASSGVGRLVCRIGVLPLLAMVKIALLIVPISMWHWIAMLLSCLRHLPRTAYWAAITIWRTPLIRVAIAKVVALVLLPIVLLLWVVAVAVFSLLGGMLYTVIFVVVVTATSDKDIITAGMSDVVHGTVEHVNTFSEFASTHMFTYMESLRQQERPPSTGCPCHPVLVTMSLVAAVCGLVVVGLLFTVLLLAKLPLLIGRSYIHLVKYRRDWGCSARAMRENWIKLPLLVVVLCTLPAWVALGVVLVSVGGFLLGLWSGVVSFNARRWRCGFRFMGLAVWKLDRDTNSFIFNTMNPKPWVPVAWSFGEPDGNPFVVAVRPERPVLPTAASPVAGSGVGSGDASAATAVDTAAASGGGASGAGGAGVAAAVDSVAADAGAATAPVDATASPQAASGDAAPPPPGVAARDGDAVDAASTASGAGAAEPSTPRGDGDSVSGSGDGAGAAVASDVAVAVGDDADVAADAVTGSVVAVRVEDGVEYAPSGLRLDPIVRTDVPDEWVELTTAEDDVYFLNRARNQFTTADPRVPAPQP